MVDPASEIRDRRGGWGRAYAAVLVAIILAGCGGSTTTKTLVRTVTQTVSTTTATAVPTTTTSASTSTQPTTTALSASPGTIPALNGTYAITQTSHQDDINLVKLGGGLTGNPHDGIYNADTKWVVLGGACNRQGCTVNFRRILSDNTLEGLLLSAPKPTGDYTGNAAGTLGTADCGVPIKERMIVRVGGIQQINGQQIATRLAGVITADYQCPGSRTTNVVATYTGTRT